MEFLKKYFETKDGSPLEIRERLFRFMLLFGVFATVFAIVESIILTPHVNTLLPLGFLFAIVLFCMYLTIKRRKTETAATIIGIYMTVIVLPYMFFDNGGVRGGATIWFILGILYAFILFKGKRLVIFLILNICADAAVYGIGFHYPQMINSLSGEKMIYLDSLFAVISVGLFCGGAMYYQIVLYDRESTMVKEQKRELEDANRSQNLFFASMSHEIRTPINSILGLNEMILRKSKDPEVVEYAANIQSSSRMLLKLVNDILDMSQLKQKRMELSLREYKTEDMFREIVDMLRIRIEEKHLDFVVDMDPHTPKRLLGDDKRIQQIIINVLTNAVKYTNEGSVSLTVTSIPSYENCVGLQIAIQDTGIGIRKEDMGKLYDVFKRVDSDRNIHVEGSGLGLSITKQLVDLMDGEIKVDSIYTKGTTFTIIINQQIVDADPVGEITFATNLSPETAYEYDHLFEAPEARVLVVDDNRVNAMVLTQLLADTRVSVDIATSGTECLEKTKQKPYHVILMDNMMPDMSGTETYKIIRKQENGLCQNTPVILLTATSVSDARKIAEENGFDSFLEKPIQGDKLEEAILSFLPESLIEYRKTWNVEESLEREKTSFTHKRKKKIQITTDCICDLPESLLEEYDIRMMYLYIDTGKARFADSKEIDSDNLLNIINGQKGSPKAVSASVEEFEEFFAESLTVAENVIHISMAANTGNSYGAAVAAAKGFDHVHVIDGKHISCGQGLLVLMACNMIENGATLEEIIAEIEKQKTRVKSAFLMPDADVFYRNGFTSKVMADIVRAIHARPVISVDHKSRIRISGLYFGSLDDCRRRFIRNMLLRKGNILPNIVSITYAGLNYEEQEYVKSNIERRMKFNDLIMHKSSFSASCNVGLKTFGFAYYKKLED